MRYFTQTAFLLKQLLFHDLFPLNQFYVVFDIYLKYAQKLLP